MFSSPFGPDAPTFWTGPSRPFDWCPIHGSPFL